MATATTRGPQVPRGTEMPPTEMPPTMPAEQAKGQTMRGAILPGNSTVEFRDFAIPTPQHGEVLVKIRASSICGSDTRAIYRAHIGKGAEAYVPGTIAGHEPCGEVAKVGPGCKALRVGDRVSVYHISGCGVCDDCRAGYQISCTNKVRAAYGWQRNGGHAPFMLADERDCVLLPDSVTYEDGALCACGLGTAWEALSRIGVSGRDVLLVVGLGPVGLGAAMLGRALGAEKVIGAEPSAERRKFAEAIGAVDATVETGDGALARVKELTGGRGCERGIDCSGTAAGRLLAVTGARRWGRIAFVGEGQKGAVEQDTSEMLIHPQLTVFGSWVTSVQHMSDLVQHLARWGLHPDKMVTDRLPLSEAGRAYELAAKGQGGKVVIEFD